MEVSDLGFIIAQSPPIRSRDIGMRGSNQAPGVGAYWEPHYHERPRGELCTGPVPSLYVGGGLALIHPGAYGGSYERVTLQKMPLLARRKRVSTGRWVIPKLPAKPLCRSRAGAEPNVL